MARSDPTFAHHLRFARTLALVSSLGASSAGCYAAHGVPGALPDSAAPDGAIPDSAIPDSATPDSPPIADAGRDAMLTCETCQCSWESPTPGTGCEENGLWSCCAMVGPLAPPDLPV